MTLKTRHNFLLFIILGILGLGCVDQNPNEPLNGDDEVSEKEVLDENECGIASNKHSVIVRQISFAPELEDGVTRGLNLDDRISGNDDEETCGQADLTAPDGTEGIDNQFSQLLPLLDTAASLDSVQALIARTINSGGLSLALDMNRLDDFENDACVEVAILSADGVPRIGANGLIEAGQTLDIDRNTEPVPVDNASIVEGRFTAGPIDFLVPLTVDTFDVPLTIRNATISADFAEDGHLEGLIAGAIVVPEVVEEISQISASGDLLRLMANVLEDQADLARNEDGVCQNLSVTLNFEAAPIFFFDEES